MIYTYYPDSKAIEIPNVFQLNELMELIIGKSVVEVAQEEGITRAVPFIVQILIALPAPQRHFFNWSATFWNYLNENIWGEGSGDKEVFAEHYKVYRNFCRTSNFRYHEVNLGSQICQSIELFNDFIVCGFTDGSVTIYRYGENNNQRIIPKRNYYSFPRPRLGLPVVGIILEGVPDPEDLQVTFGCMDGYIFRANISSKDLYLLYEGDYNSDGCMIDINGNRIGYVALYVGVPEHSFRVWNTEGVIIYEGGDFMAPDAHVGIPMNTLMNTVTPGRVLISDNIIIGCNVRTLVSFAVADPELILNSVMFGNETAIVQTLSCNGQSFIVGTTDLYFRVRKIQSFQVTHRIRAFQFGANVCVGVHKRYLTLLGFTNGRIFAYDSHSAQIASDHPEEPNRRFLQPLLVPDIQTLATNYKLVVATAPGVLNVWV